jgi:hypothetical protein
MAAAAQGILRCQAYTTEVRDGIYDSVWVSPMSSYQSKHGLTADGIVGTNTWAQLRSDTPYLGNVDNWWVYGASGSGSDCGTEATFYRESRTSSVYYGAWYVVKSACCGVVPLTSQQLSI